MMSSTATKSASTGLSDPFRASHVASLLGKLAEQLNAKTGPGLTPIIAECDAAILDSLEVARDQKSEPSKPTAQELLYLARMLQRAEPEDLVILLRQIRRILGRVDARW